MAARYLALGDSYTIGEGVAANERWPVRLAALLRARAVDLEEPAILARTGWTTAELLAALDAAPPHGPFDLVSLLIGVNDQYRGRALADYEKGFRALLDRAITLARGAPTRVVVLSIPDWGVTPFAAGRDRSRIAREVDDFSLASLRTVQLAGARYVDVTRSSRRAGREPVLLASDGLHPSGAMYAEWARLVLPAAWQALRDGGRGAA